jgi:peroxiredoxin Q/BCP
VFGISTDDRETLKRFKDKVGAPYAFLSDPDGRVSRQYSGLIPVVKVANRANVVVGADGIVKELVTGGDAIDPSSAIAACPAAGAGS